MSSRVGNARLELYLKPKLCIRDNAFIMKHPEPVSIDRLWEVPSNAEIPHHQAEPTWSTEKLTGIPQNKRTEGRIPPSPRCTNNRRVSATEVETDIDSPVSWV